MGPEPLDLRSDVVAALSPAMWAAMQTARPQWPPERDPLVRELEATVAQCLAKEAAFFVPSGAAANTLALLVQARPGGRLLLTADAHIASSEGWDETAIAGLAPLRLPGSQGHPVASAMTMSLARLAPAVAAASLVTLENTHTAAGGTLLTAEQTATLAAIAQRHGARVHLDGARLFNAAVALGCPLTALAGPVDTVAVSLNKGLGAPFGAVLAGPEPVIAAARQRARRLGLTSIHKLGHFAAAGLVALETMIERLADDHRRAAALARWLAPLPGLRLDLTSVQTNIVLVDTAPSGLSLADWSERLAARGVLVLPRPPHGLRFVTHRQIDDAAIERVGAAVAAILTYAEERPAGRD